ncbi:MAG: Aldehyde oxidoreductase, partial [Anaerocolumna sp.]|nr:Aldehyde oxidoreductase [Anaerocolumna sp.]
MLKKALIINGAKTILVVEPEAKLSDVLRKQLGLTGTKVGCGIGECGSCSVILNGKVVKSCITKMKKIEENSEIITIEGVGNKDKLHPLQVTWMVHGAAQCGFCT